MDTKNWLQFEQHYSHSVFNFYFFGKKKIRRQMSWHVLKLDLNSARWMPKLVVSIDAQSYPALTSQSLRATIGPLQDNWPLFHYVIGISGILPYNRNVTLQALELFSVLSHGSIMLPPRQPCVFGRLGLLAIMTLWAQQLKFYHNTIDEGTAHVNCHAKKSQAQSNCFTLNLLVI